MCIYVCVEVDNVKLKGKLCKTARGKMKRGKEKGERVTAMATATGTEMRVTDLELCVC